MKKQLSILMLLVRSTVCKALLIFAAMTVSQIILFFVFGAAEELYLLNALNRIPSIYVVVAGLWLIYFVLSSALKDKGGRMNNLILRLGISEKRIYWIHVVCNTLVFGLFFMVQGLVYLLLCGIYDWVTPGTLDPMTVFVTSYQHSLFHRFFPLNNVVAWLTNMVLVFGLSICTAAVPVRQRRRYSSTSSYCLMVYASSLLFTYIGGEHLGYSSFGTTFLVVLFCAFISLWGVLTLEVDDYGKA